MRTEENAIKFTMKFKIFTKTHHRPLKLTGTHNDQANNNISWLVNSFIT